MIQNNDNNKKTNAGKTRKIIGLWSEPQTNTAQLKCVLLNLVFIFACPAFYGQQKLTGRVLNPDSKSPVEYVNIGIVGKNIGTVSDQHGVFNLWIEPPYQNDSLLFSRIGFESRSVKISDIKENDVIRLKEKTYSLKEVTIKPRRFKERRLGITTKSNLIIAGFANNKLGHEMGLLMKIKKTAILKSVNINIAKCEYDTIFYRLNIYETKGKNDFEPILKKPIYIHISKHDIRNGAIQIDLKDQQIIVNGNFLVTLEHVRELGDRGLYFSCGLKQKTYFRTTSQGSWATAPVGISLSVAADVEK